MRRLFDRLDVWYDAQPRSGAENMAVDQLLMEQAGPRPVLRVYHWSGPTVSFGYFLPLSSAVGAFPGPGLTYVRRWTGGGVVDHREDVTYTLAIPSGNEVAAMRGAGSYREIHTVLATALSRLGKDARLAAGGTGSGAAACFANPVAHDITDTSGAKLAGAGQRRNKHGLLHQGSVAAGVGARALFGQLAELLAEKNEPFAPTKNMLEMARDLAESRYATDAWQTMR